MLSLTLREEFRGRNLQGTTISFHTQNSEGAIDKTPADFLKITYPTADVIKALKTVRADRDGGPVVLMGGRGKGKSHLMAVLHHAVSSPEVTEKWLKNWADTLGNPFLQEFKIAKGFIPISESVNNNEFPNLWELLFARHEKGEYFRGKFAQTGQNMPARTLLEEMFAAHPTCLILDEFQTWYDALPALNPNTGIDEKLCAFSFIQTLSEISKEQPDILMLIVSVRNNDTEAFKQIHRQGPVLIDFSGETAKQDRQKLILHRLFENRLQISDSAIMQLTSSYAKERFRLISGPKGSGNAQKDVDEVCACWPFAPELLSLLEDQILMASAAQETRDMIRILAMVFKSKGETTPVITSSDFTVEGDAAEVQSLVDSIAQDMNQEKLREIARRNLEEIQESGADIPYKSGMVASIWMHSMAPDRLRGIKAAELQLAISAHGAIDDNSFRLQISALVENSVNIHCNLSSQNYWFEQSKNTKTEVRVAAKNDHIWDRNADPNNHINHPGKDVEWLMRTLRKCFVNESTQPPSDVIVLGPHWNTSPWSDVRENEQPDKWSKLELLVLPGSFTGSGKNINTELGKWLKANISKRRNTVRFLLQDGNRDIFEDRDLLFAARCSYLCSPEAWGSAPEYRAIRNEFDKTLEDSLRPRFNRFAVLRKWDYQNPEQCEFEVEHLEKSGLEVPAAVEEAIKKNVFDLTEFQKRICDAAKEGFNIGEMLNEFVEPNTGDVLAFIGEQKSHELIQELGAQGKIALNVDGTWYRKEAGQSLEDARHYFRSKTSRSGSELRRIQLGEASVAGGYGVVTHQTPQPNPPHNPASHANPPVQQPVTTQATPAPATSADLPPAPPVPPIRTVQTRHAPSTNGVTLIGNFETWDLKEDQKLKSATLNIDGITVHALKSFILRLPSTIKASLDVSFDSEEN